MSEKKDCDKMAAEHNPIALPSLAGAAGFVGGGIVGAKLGVASVPAAAVIGAASGSVLFNDINQLIGKSPSTVQAIGGAVSGALAGAVSAPVVGAAGGAYLGARGGYQIGDKGERLLVKLACEGINLLADDKPVAPKSSDFPYPPPTPVPSRNR